MAEQVLLEVRGLSKHFPAGGVFSRRHVHALNEASFTIAKGEVVSLVGESGSGKSTTARLIARLMPATDGEIIFDGDDVLKTEARGASKNYRRKVQMIFQDPFGSLNGSHTIGHHLERPLRIHKMAQGKAVLERIHELLETVGLSPVTDVAARFPHELSGGQRQRVAIARALAVNPRLILADEPISMLDVSIRAGILNLMEQLKEERGIGFLYITHDLASARYIGDKTIVMYAGHMVESADSSELMAAPAHPYTELLKSAVPDPNRGLGTRKLQARGELPSLSHPPQGCPFAVRCPAVMNICNQVMPEKTTLTSSRWVRCHLHSEKNHQ